MKKLLAPLLLLIILPQAFSQSFQIKLAAKFDARIDNTVYRISKQFGFDGRGDLFFAIDDNKSLTVWETESQRRRFTLAGNFREASFSPDGKWLAISSKKEIVIADAETGKTHANSNKYNGEIKFLDWNPNSENFVVGAQNFTVEILNAATGTLLSSAVIHERKKGFFAKFDSDDADFIFIDAVFTPDGNRILTTCHDSTAKLWDIQTGKMVRVFTHKPHILYQGASQEPSTILEGKISFDGKWIITSGYYDARLWSAETGKLIKEFVGYGSPSFSPDSRYLGLINDPNGDRSVKMMNLATPETKTLLDKYSGELIAWNPDSRSFITDRTIDERSKNAAYIWETETGKQKAALKTYSKGCFDLVSTCLSDFDRFSFSPNGKILMAQNKKQIRFINPNDGATIFTLSEAAATALWSPKGDYVLARDIEKGKLGLWKIDF